LFYFVTIVALTDGLVTIQVPANVAQTEDQDPKARGNMASVTATVRATVNEGNITGPSGPVTGPFDITITFDTDIAFNTFNRGGPFALSNILVENGTASNLQGSGPVYTARITPADDGLVTVNILDIPSWQLGEIVAVGSAQLPYTVRADLPPMPTIAGPAGPVTGAFRITVMFSEAVTGFDVSDLTVVNGTVMANSFSGSGTSYSATIIPTMNDEVTVNIAAGAANAVVGSAGNSAAEQYMVTADLPDPGITLSRTALEVNEDGNGNSTAYTVVLDTEPTADVTVSLTIDPAVVPNPDFPDTPLGGVARLSTTQLNFTTQNWNVPQTVTVTGINDDNVNAGGQRTATINHAASGGDYADVSATPLTVTVRDDDGSRITLSSTEVTIDESGANNSAEYTVVLDTEPTGPVTVTPTIDPPTTTDPNSGEILTGVVTVTPTDLTFNRTGPMAWNTPQTVTVTGVNDSVDNPDNQRRATVTHTASGGGYNTTSSLRVTVTNNDDTAGVTLSRPSLTIAEVPQRVGGVAILQTETYNIRLNTEPTGTVTVTLASDRFMGATVSPDILNFTTQNWNVPQTVSVTSVNDMIDQGNQRMTMVTHTFDGGGYDDVTATAAVTVLDNNDFAGVLLSTATLRVAEDGSTETYTVVLNSAPTGTVTITPTSSDTDVATVSGPLMFNSTNWNQAQMITVTGGSDAIQGGDRTVTISHTITTTGTGDGYDRDPQNPENELTVRNVAVTVTDNDMAGLTYRRSATDTSRAIQINEASIRGQTYQVRLNTQPTGRVTLTPMSSNTNLVTASGTGLGGVLIFTPNNWDEFQTVTVAVATGVNDDTDHDRDRTATITHRSVSHGEEQDGTTSDENYGGEAGVVIDETTGVMVTVTDSAHGVTVTPTTLRVEEEGGTATYEVVLDGPPTADVEIAITAPAEVTVSATTLTFTPDNWEDEQEVTVTGANNNIASGDQEVMITHAATSDDANYNGNNRSISSVTVTVEDNDTAGVTIAEPQDGITIAEDGGTAEYTIALTSQPTNDVQITITPPAGVTVSPTTLTFTATGTTDASGNITGRWNQPQTVTVTGEPNAIDNGRSYSDPRDPPGGSHPVSNRADLRRRQLDQDRDRDSAERRHRQGRSQRHHHPYDYRQHRHRRRLRERHH